MWWKLALVGIVTLALVIAVQPIRTHAVKIDISADGKVEQLPRQGLLDFLSAMYVTPTSLLISAVIVGIAAYLVYRIVR